MSVTLKSLEQVWNMLSAEGYAGYAETVRMAADEIERLRAAAVGANAGTEPDAWLRLSPDGQRRVATVKPGLDRWQEYDGWRVVPLYAVGAAVRAEIIPSDKRRWRPGA
jgi:hypothetical protein